MKSGIETLADDFIKKAESQGWVDTFVQSNWGSNYTMVFLEKKTENERVIIAILTDIQFSFYTFSHLTIEKEESIRVYGNQRYFRKYQKEVEKLFEN